MAMATKFSDTGSSIQVLTFDKERLHDKLPPAVYVVNYSQMTGFSLGKRSDRMQAPERIYGSTAKRADKIMTAYANAPGAFGVLMSGDKGSGKTMTSTLVANQAIEQGLPVIIVDTQLPGSALSEFISTLGECVLFFDEFAKTFTDKDNQQALLGMFDGATAGRRLALLTENSLHSVSQYMMNRPGRMFYHFRHGRVEEAVIEEFCADKGVPEATIKDIISRRDRSTEFSFDVLQAIVREYQMFGGEIDEICADLNIEQPRTFKEEPEAEVISVFDVTNQIKRKLHHRSLRAIIRMPSDNEYARFHLESVPDETEEAVTTASEESLTEAQLQVKRVLQARHRSADTVHVQASDQIAEPDEMGVIAYATRDDENNQLIVKLRQKPEVASWYMPYV